MVISRRVRPDHHDIWFVTEFFVGRTQNIDIDIRQRAIAASLDQDRTLVKNFRRLKDFPLAEKMAALLKPNCTNRRLMTRLSTCETRSRELDHVDLDAASGEVIQQRLNQLIWFVVQEESPVE